MADIQEAAHFVLRQEDARLTGAVTEMPGDPGGMTRYGIAARFHPQLVSDGFFDAGKMDAEEALSIAQKVYEEEYADPLLLEQISNQDVADRILSFAVNEGIHEAVALVQQALNLCGHSVAIDGCLGVVTLQALNDTDPARFLSVLRVLEEGFYRHLVAVRPSLSPYLDGFLNRASA